MVHLKVPKEFYDDNVWDELYRVMNTRGIYKYICVSMEINCQSIEKYFSNVVLGGKNSDVKKNICYRV